ncbi:MAG TPA: DUF6093 family protein [Acidimicrobiia bacterium]|nr:DUF6093 family protein [Acidimicrobiia bacterium]
MSTFVDTAALLRTFADFPDTCTVTRVTGRTLNTTTGVYTDTTSTPYTGECLYRKRATGEAAFGEQLNQQVAGDLYLPYDSTPLLEEDRVEVVSAMDDAIPTLTVLRLVTDSYMVRRHYECEGHP